MPSDLPWTRIKLAGLTRLVSAPPALRWEWATDQHDGRKRLLLRSPRGRLWQFRLNRGAWVRRVETFPPACAGSPGT